uniref:NADH dehydrogenase [ubiquinone] 1 beta subcomplex subunit 9 n=1 Tax=Oncorhynchus mykiss TaxID=8022 RepID=A0A8C7QRD1_ONCMY
VGISILCSYQSHQHLISLLHCKAFHIDYCLARFDKARDEKDMVKPYLFPDSPGGTSYERYEMYKVPEWCLDHWHPSDGHVSYFAKREQWKNLREQSWDREVGQLQGVTPAIAPKSEALPPVRKNCDLPPLWWQYVTCPRERPVFEPPDDTTW